MSEKGCGRVALLSGRTITLAMGVTTCSREHHRALGARISQNLSRLRRSEHLTAILISVGSGVFIIAAGRIFRQIIVVHTASAANRRLVSTAAVTGINLDGNYCSVLLYQIFALECRGKRPSTKPNMRRRASPWIAEGFSLMARGAYQVKFSIYLDC